jgi:hypothetical protein
VTALNPVGYWPLSETTPPPLGYYVATNLGSAGAAGNGYYQTWHHPVTVGTSNLYYISNNIARTAGATGDGDQALQCNYSAGRGQYVVLPRFSNGVANPVTTIQAPFSIEVWIKPAATNHGLLPIVSEGRVAVQGDANSTPPYTNTMRGFNLGTFNNFVYFQVYKGTRADHNGQPEIDVRFLSPNTWYHLVATYDGTTERIYTNGILVASASSPGYVPDPTSPLLIATGPEISGSGGAEWDGAIDDVAIYPSALSQTQITNHYSASLSGTYTSAVQADTPSIYLRLNEPAPATPPDPSTYPVANNYGSLGSAANGVYQPGTAPGVPGPAFSGFGGSSRAVAINGFFGGVDVGGGALPAQMNPTGNQPFSVVTWFQGNPADAPGRFQSLVGHSDRSWRLTMDGAPGDNVQLGASIHFNAGNGPELQFANTADVVTNHFVLNDGKWHMAAGVSDGTTEYLYLDGVLAKTNTTALGSIVGTNLDVMIGGDPQYTVPTYNGSPGLRYFNGQVAQVAFFTNALSAAQIQQLYGAAGVPASIVAQLPVSQTNNAGDNISIPVAARGSAPLSYQWYRIDGTPVGGQTTSALTFNPATTNNSGSYYVIVSNSAGSATSSVVQLTILGPPILQQQSLTDVRVFVGTTPTLRVTASGPQPIIYQWKKNGVSISGATNSSYTISNTAATGTSTYDCTVTNFAGAAAINPITVSVLADPTAPYPASVLADHPIVYYPLDEGPDNGAGNNGATAYDYAGGLNTTYSNVDLGQPGYSSATDPTETSSRYGYANGAFMDSYAGNAPTYLDFSKPNGNSVAFSIETWINSTLIPGTDAGIVTIGYGFGGEQFALDCGARVSGARALRFYVNDAANSTHTAASANGNLLGDNIWHHVVAVCDEPNGHVYLYIDGVLSGNATIGTTAGLRGLTAPLSIGSRLSTSAATDYDNQFFGSINDVAVYNYALSPTQVANHYLGAGIAPTITQLQPSDLRTNQGATAIFTATATGTAPLSYQWADNNGAPIPWGTNASLSLTNVQQDQAGFYSLTVSNAYGVATTNASLEVDLGAPTITVDLQPTNQTVYAGVSLSYSVTVSGSSPFSYQWYRNGSVVSGATNSAYAFTSLLGTNTYYCVVTNAYSYSQLGGPTYSSTGTVVGVTAPTLDPLTYGYKMKISFSGYTHTDALADFPALVKLGTNTPGFSYSQLASATGGDLRFTDANGTREIPHEIDEWNPGGISTIWVQVPRLTGTNDYIWAYWGNAGDTTPPAYATNGSVWLPQPFENLPGFEVVYHLKEGAFPFRDSTLQHSATTGIAPAATNGAVGQGGIFNGSFLDAGAFDLTDTFTLSAWVNITTGSSDIQTVWANQVGGFGMPGFAMTIDSYQTSDQQLRLSSGDGVAGNETATANGAVSFGQWHLLAESINRTNGTVDFYVDGNKLSSSTTVVRSFPTTNDVNFGQFLNGSFRMHGLMDEARIRSGNSSTDWIWASYMTVANNSTFQTYGTVTSSGVTLNYQTLNGKLVLSWSQGTLQGASQVSGPYTDISSATSPYTNSPTASQQYFRVRVR